MKIPVYSSKFVGEFPLDFINNVRINRNINKVTRFIFKNARISKSIYGITLTIKKCQN